MRKNAPAVAARREITERTARAATLSELVEQDGASQEEPRQALGALTRIARSREEPVFVLQTRECEEERAHGEVGVAVRAHHRAGVRGGGAVAGCEDASLGERLNGVKPADDLGVACGELPGILACRECAFTP